jgi:hypothetical protein
MPDGSRRAVTAHWHLTDGAKLAGTVTSRES